MHISYTEQAERAVRYATKKAKEMQHPYIGTEHLLLGTEVRVFRSCRSDPGAERGWRKKMCSALWTN